MSNEFMREERYIVFKMSDLGNALKGDEIRRLAREYAEHRQRLRKKPLECVVVEKDWPEYEATWKAIEARVHGAQPAPSVPEGWQLVPTAESRHPGIYKMLGALHAADNTPGMSGWESYRAMLAAAPEIKP